MNDLKTQKEKNIYSSRQNEIHEVFLVISSC